MQSIIGDIADVIQFRRGVRPEIAAVQDRLRDDIRRRSLSSILDVDSFPLTLRQYEVITEKYTVQVMDWNKMMLLFKIASFVRVEDKDDVIRHLADTYGIWIITNGGIKRLGRRPSLIQQLPFRNRQ